MIERTFYSKPSLDVDYRGNALLDWEVRASGATTTIPLRCAYAVCRQIQSALSAAGKVVRPTGFPEEEGDRWTHCLEFQGEPPADFNAFLSLLARIVVLQDLPSDVRHGVALGFYKHPPSATGLEYWKNTDIGELVYTMKYRPQDPFAQSSALNELADKLAEVVSLHPVLRGSRVLSVPGSDSSKRSQSEALAEQVSLRAGLLLTRVRSRKLVRPPAKNAERRLDLRGEFEVTPLPGARVLIIDDVYDKGGTMQGVAHAARQAGAVEINCLVAARTH